MTTPTPQLQHTPYGLRIDAPIERPHPVVSLLIAYFGVAIIAFSLGITWGIGLFGLLIAVPSTLMGMVIVPLGVWLLVGSRRVLVKRGELKLWYGIGPIGGAITLPKRDLERLRVRAVSSSKGGGFEMPYELVAELTRDGTKGKDSAQLSAGIDPASLIACGGAIAEAVGTECAVARALRSTDAPEQHADTPVLPPADAVYPKAPAKCPFTLEEKPGHVTLYASMDASAKSRSRSFIGMGVFFIVLIVLVGGGFIYSGAFARLPIAMGVGSIALLFVMIGLTMLGYGVLSARDKWIIDVTGGQLIATFTHLGRVRTRQISVAEMRAIRVAHTGESWGGDDHNPGTPVLQLRLVPKRGPSLRLMTGCSEESLEWAGRVFGLALGIEPESLDPTQTRRRGRSGASDNVSDLTADTSSWGGGGDSFDGGGGGDGGGGMD